MDSPALSPPVMNPTEKTAKDPRVVATLSELTKLASWIDQHYRIPLPGDWHSRIALGCFDVAIEHQAAIQLLARQELYGSMLVLVRALFESFIRGCWLARCATDADREYFVEHDEIPQRRGMEKLVTEVELALGHDLEVLLRMKRVHWGPLCSFTHTGIEQVVRRNGDGFTGPNYTPNDVVNALRLAGALGILAAGEMAAIANDQPLALATLERAKQFAASHRASDSI